MRRDALAYESGDADLALSALADAAKPSIGKAVGKATSKVVKMAKAT